MTKRAGFTVVELLVVMSIIILLIALLLPALGRARASTRITVCASQLRQMGSGLSAYANDFSNELPPGNGSHWTGTGSDVTWFVNASPGWPEYAARGDGRPMGLAFLLMNDYVTEAQTAYCPSWTHPYHQYDKTDADGSDPNGAPHVYGGWPAPGNPGPTIYRGISYLYRSTFGANTANIGDHVNLNGRPADMDRQRGAAIAADHWVERHVPWSLYGHDDGYNAVYLDGSCLWKADDDHTYMLTNNMPYSHARWGLQERIWQEFFDP